MSLPRSCPPLILQVRSWCWRSSTDAVGAQLRSSQNTGVLPAMLLWGKWAPCQADPIERANCAHTVPKNPHKVMGRILTCSESTERVGVHKGQCSCGFRHHKKAPVITKTGQRQQHLRNGGLMSQADCWTLVCQRNEASMVTARGIARSAG